MNDIVERAFHNTDKELARAKTESHSFIGQEKYRRYLQVQKKAGN